MKNVHLISIPRVYCLLFNVIETIKTERFDKKPKIETEVAGIGLKLAVNSSEIVRKSFDFRFFRVYGFLFHKTDVILM